jgi:hypothetical protein
VTGNLAGCHSLIALASEMTSTGARAGWQGADPYDGLWWRWPSALTSGKRRRQALIQLHARAPIDIRRTYRRPYSRISKTLGLFGAASVLLWKLTRDDAHLHQARAALDALMEDRSAGKSAWGYPWDTQTRWGFYRAGTPNIIATVFAAEALQDGADAFGDARYVARARDAAEWLGDELWLGDAEIFVYHTGSTVLIHNANMLGSALVRRILPDDPRPDLAVSRTLAAQLPDGSWPYGDGNAKMAFVDSFHTGYVLRALSRFHVRDDVRTALADGAEYYTSRFFDLGGRALLWPNQRYPEDAHSAGTALSTLSALFTLGIAEREPLETACGRVRSHVVRNGHAIHRRGRGWRSTVRYPRWCDGHVALGLAHAAAALGEAGHHT